MSNFRFGADDYKLSYYPPEASNGIGGVDWDKVESVEIEFDEFVKVVRCRDCKFLVSQINDDPLCIRPYENVALWTNLDGFCAWGKRRERESVEVWNQWSADDVTCSEES